MVRFILASQSPRRRELLGLCGYPFDTKVAAVDEDSVSDPDPAQDCIQTARLKAEAIFHQHRLPRQDRSIIIAADTIVALDGQILGKPRNAADANRMLSALCGRTHEVHTGVTIIDVDSGREILGSHTAVVNMRHYTSQEITNYIATGDPLDKAGAYAIQNPVFKPVEKLDGCYLGVMGLSICHLLQLLRQLDLPFKSDIEALKTAHQHYKCRLYDNIAQRHGKKGAD